MIKRFDITTDGSGDYVGTIELRDAAFLVMARWEDGDLVDGVDATLTQTQPAPGDVVDTVLTLTNANADAIYYPRVLEHDAAAAELATTTLALLHGTLTLTVADGGATKTGALWLYLLPLGE